MSMLLDATLALSLMTYSIVHADLQAVRTNERNTAIQTGQYMNGLQGGVNKYIAVNGDQLAGRAPATYTDPSGNPIALADPYHPTVAELQKFGFLPLGYTTNNPSKLAFSIEVDPANCPGVGCQLPAVISSSPYRDSQNRVRNDLMAFAVNSAGLDGGQSLPGSPGQFTSRGGAWRLPNAGGAVGSLAMRAGSLTTGYVDTLPFYKLDGSRRLTGTMQANGQSIVGANNVQSASLNTGTASVAGNLSTGTANVAGTLSAGTANVSGNLSAANAFVAGGLSANTFATNFAQVNGTLTAANASVSGGLSADTVATNFAQVNGNVSVGGALSANTATVNGLQTNGDSMTLGNATVNGALTARNIVNLPALAIEGWGCAGNAVTTDPGGRVLSCQSGVWRAETVTNINNFPTTIVNQGPPTPYVTGFIVTCDKTMARMSDGSQQLVWTASFNCGGGG